MKNRWVFHSIAELQKALEEYTALVDLQLVRSSEPPDEADPDPKKMDAQYRIMAQNREIDARMARLVVSSPTYARLLHWYYRTGNSTEAEGWKVAARKAGIPNRSRMFRGKDMCRAQFEVVLDLALRELFYVR